MNTHKRRIALERTITELELQLTKTSVSDPRFDLIQHRLDVLTGILLEEVGHRDPWTE